MKQFLHILARKYRKICLRKQNIVVEGNSEVTLCSFDVDGYVSIGKGTIMYRSHVGRGTYIRNDCEFVNTSIGRYCSIAPGVKVVIGEHPTKKYVSTSPMLYDSKNIAGLYYGHTSYFNTYKYANNTDYYCVIGNDVWIGQDVLIMGGVTIGDGAVIASGTIITKDVPCYAVMAGVPAIVKRYRFDKAQIECLKKIAWWNKDTEWIRNNVSLFDDINEFLKWNE